MARAVVGTGAYLAGIGVLGLCLGMLTRSIGPGVGWLVGLVLVVPGFGAILLPDNFQDALKYLPSNAGAAFTGLTASSSQLEMQVGVAVFAGWVPVFAAAAGVAIRRRDVWPPQRDVYHGRMTLIHGPLAATLRFSRCARSSNGKSRS